MEQFFLDYLFNHFFFVNQPEQATENMAETRLALGQFFNIRITGGADLLQPVMIRQAESALGGNVPRSFYLGFPESVLKLSGNELIADQILHYYRTYGTGDFSEAGHSLFEEEIERKIFSEETPVKDFAVLSEPEAIEKLREYTDNLLSGTRQLSSSQYNLALKSIQTYGFPVGKVTSKNTAIRLLVDLRDLSLTDSLTLSDVPKLADELNHRATGSKHANKLNLRNQDRKLLTAVMDKLIAEGKIDTRNCYEKKALWSGLLHHIHYRTEDPKGAEFVKAMRGSENRSVLSEFETVLATDGPAAAADLLVRRKGSGALLRNIDYLMSRCSSDEEVKAVIGQIKTQNKVILIQLMFHYYKETAAARRTFKFIRYGLMKKHIETPQEIEKRKTVLAVRDRKAAAAVIREQLEESLKNRLGKVYIDPAMKRIALPIQDGASMGGFGTLSKGSRIPLPEGKKIRAFTYWEKVNDIDLSAIGLDKNLRQHEFSWRTMAREQSSAITFSGDQTSGYYGGSEYFDIDLERIREKYPSMRYLIFCNNIFSGLDSFRKCVCRAGFMMRDVADSGEIFEPKTVKTSFTIDCESKFAYLFGVDLMTNEIVWLNIGNSRKSRIAGQNHMAFMTQYFDITEVFNLYDFFTMMASELVDDPKEADIAVTDEDIEARENTAIIRSWDSERMIALMNQQTAGGIQ